MDSGHRPAVGAVVTIYASSNEAEVFNNITEAVLFPGTIYLSEPYETFPFGTAGANQFQDNAKRKGEHGFSGDEPDQLYPLICWFHVPVSDWSMENCRVNDRIVAGTIVVAHIVGPTESIHNALGRVSRDQKLIQEYFGRQNTEAGLSYGPFGKTFPSLIPSSFGTVMNIFDPEFSVVDARPEPELGPNVAVGAVGVRLRMLVI